MGRLALRPGLRAYAHAPAVETAVPFTNTKSVLLDGSDDSYASDSNLTVGANACSMTWWQKGSGFSQSVMRAGALQMRFFFVFRFSANGATNEIWASSVSSTDWEHWAAVVTSAGWTYLYQDGAEVMKREVNTTLVAADYPATIGTFAGGGYWAGNIDEWAFWDGTALSAAQVAEIYNDPDGAYDLKNSFSGPDPTIWLRMGDDPGDSGGASGVLIDQMGTVDFSAGDGAGTGAPVVEEDVPPT